LRIQIKCRSGFEYSVLQPKKIVCLSMADSLVVLDFNEEQISEDPALLAAIEQTKKLKRGMNTRTGYTTSLNQFFGWIESSPAYHSMIENRELQPSFQIRALLAFCEQKRKRTKDGELATLGYSGLNRYRSALMCYLEEHKLLHLITEEDRTEMNLFFAGVKKRVQQEKQEGEREMKEGKESLPSDIYIALADEFWKSANFFALCYLTLSWNLCCRTNNTEGIKLSHILWQGDALQIMFGITKNNQDGERLESRLIFANSDCPTICPVLALGVWMMSVNKQMTPSDSLFFGGHQAVRFNHILSKTLRLPRFLELLSQFGLKPEGNYFFLDFWILTFILKMLALIPCEKEQEPQLQLVLQMDLLLQPSVSEWGGHWEM